MKVLWGENARMRIPSDFFFIFPKVAWESYQVIYRCRQIGVWKTSKIGFVGVMGYEECGDRIKFPRKFGI